MPPKFSKEIEERIVYPERLEFQPRTSPCEVNCPAGNPIQKSQALIKEGRLEEALAYLRSRNPFPGITGRICAHPCEVDCNRGQYDEKISIRGLERFAADRADLTRVSKPKRREPTGKKLAIIGSGPAGMTCAYYSALLGHDVTVIESGPIPGGIPRMLVPDFRLPKDVVDREIGQVLELGVNVRTNTTVGTDVGFEDILKNFDACLVATGAWKARRLDVPGAESAIPGVEFLRRVNLGMREPVGEKVVIVGGGGVAFDCAFTAKRLGASEIHVLCVEGEGNLCATADDLAQAQAEGVRVHSSRMISRVLEQGGKAAGVEYFEISAFEFDEKGSLKVVPVGGNTQVLLADTVISAAGVEANLGFLAGKGPFQLTPKGTLAADPERPMTSVPGVFAAGDALSGPSTVAAAIGSGRRAVIAIDRYLAGQSFLEPVKVRIQEDGCLGTESSSPEPAPHVVAFEEIMNVEFFEKKGREATGKISLEASIKSFQEIDRGLEKDQGAVEAGRCLHCGHCTQCGCCVENCPGFVLTMTPEGPQPTYYDECWHCGCCRIACPGGVVYYEFPLNMMV
jgi:formate dehydrogenase (NADP+) beta subunit